MTKELELQLSHVKWSPDGSNILFGTLQCEVYIYDASGNYLAQLPLSCLDETASQTSIIGIDWYNGAEGVHVRGHTPPLTAHCPQPQGRPPTRGRCLLSLIAA